MNTETPETPALTLDQYQAVAMTYRLKSADEIYALLNLPAEVGELLSLYAKARRDGAGPELIAKATKELGDIMWSCAAIASDMGIGLNKAGTDNLWKLNGRMQRGTIQGSGDDR